MTQPISRDLRERIVALRKETKKTYEELAEHFRVGRATVSRLLSRERQTGDVAPKPHGGGMPKKVKDEELPQAKAVIDAHHDATLEELAVLLSDALGRSLSSATVGRVLVRLQVLEKEEGAPPFRAKPTQRAGEARGVRAGHRGA